MGPGQPGGSLPCPAPAQAGGAGQNEMLTSRESAQSFLTSMRIAATADLHFTPQNYDRIREQMSRVRDQADLLVLAGDLTNYGKPQEMESLLNALVRIRLPIVAVLGNHDYESGQENELMRMMTEEGI